MHGRRDRPNAAKRHEPRNQICDHQPEVSGRKLSQEASNSQLSPRRPFANRETILVSTSYSIPKPNWLQGPRAASFVTCRPSPSTHVVMPRSPSSFGRFEIEPASRNATSQNYLMSRNHSCTSVKLAFAASMWPSFAIGPARAASIRQRPSNDSFEDQTQSGRGGGGSANRQSRIRWTWAEFSAR